MRALDRARYVRGTLAICALLLAACGGEIGRSPDAPAAAAPSGGAPSPAAPTVTPAAGATPPGIGVTATGDVDCNVVPSGPRRLWRLTPAQYDNTIRDLFGMESTFGAGFPADEVVNGFRNASDLLQVNPLLADKLKAAAQDISTAADLVRLAPCASGNADDHCLRELASGFGERAFRRPLTPDDVDRYVALAKTEATFDAGARLMLQGMLQSPHFLYRFELGRHDAGMRFVLSDYEVASELSYLLWQTTPDETLLAAARSGQLHDAPAVRAQVERLLKAPQARPVVRAFVLDWLGLSTIATVPKDTARFPELTAELRGSLQAEAERFIDHVMFEDDGSLAALLTTPTTYLDQRLAEFYGVPAPADPGQPSTLVDQERRGVLTLGATMLVHARSNDSSPVHRGKLVRERLLCQTLPPPPPGIAVQPPPLDPNKTTRERYAAHSADELCATCHRLMDPIGLVFEHFDGIGRYRAEDNGQPIDDSGEILGSLRTNGTFQGSGELIDRLETSPDAQDCYSLSWLRFAYGLKEADSNLCVTKRVQAELGQSDGSLAGIISVLTENETFYTRTGLVEAPTAAEPEAPEEDDPMQPEAAAEPDMPEDLEMTLSQNNDWGDGYCKTYQLKNVSTAPVTWSVPLEVDGKINNHWECEISGDSGMVTFTGASHNATLQPGVLGQFGFCAVR